MNYLKRASSLRKIVLVAGSLGIMFASVVARNGASKGLLKKPSVELLVSAKSITFPCPPPDRYSASRSCPTTADFQVTLTAITKAFNKQSTYVYTVTGGRVVGEGSKVTWDLSETWPGIYTATVEVQDKKKHRARSSVTVTLQNCSDCVISDFPCPTIDVICYDEVRAGTPITCKIVVGRSTRAAQMTYEWSVQDSSVEDVSARIIGRGPLISIRTDGLGRQYLTTKVTVKGLDPSCSPTARASTIVKP